MMSYLEENLIYEIPKRDDKEINKIGINIDLAGWVLLTQEDQKGNQEIKIHAKDIHKMIIYLTALAGEMKIPKLPELVHPWK